MDPAVQPAKTDDELARQLWALGDVARLRLIRALPFQPDCEHASNVSQLARKLGLSQPTVSHHLRVLRQAGLVEYKRMCRDVYYWVDHDELSRVAQHILSPDAPSD